MTIEEIIAEHEYLKLKWCRLVEEDARRRLDLFDSLWDLISEKESYIEELAIGLKLARWIKSAEIQDEHSNAKKLEHALDVIFSETETEIVRWNARIKWATRKYNSLSKYHDIAKKIVYK